MRSKIWISVLGLWMAGVAGLKAQYAEVLHPQVADIAAKMKAGKFNFRAQFNNVNGVEAPYGVVAFDAQGRLYKWVDPQHIRYYTYDDNNRVTAILDSANEGRHYVKVSNTFSYDAQGRPSGVVLDNRKSAFSYNEGSRELQEEISGTNGVEEKRVYRYSAENKLTEEIFASAQGAELHKRKLLYNKFGDLSGEIQVEHNKTGRDSSATLYTYDGKGRILDKRYTLVKTLPGTAGGADARTEIVKENYSYSYSPQGQLTAMKMTSSNAKDSYVLEYTYNTDGYVTAETYKDTTGKVIKKYSYRYFYKRM